MENRVLTVYVNRGNSEIEVPAFLEIDAVISPNPTELSENKAIIKNANKIPTMSLLELKPNNNAKTKTIITCNIESIILESMLLVIKSADDIGVVLSLLSTPCPLKSENDCATVIIINMHAYENNPGTIILNIEPSSGSPNANPKVIVRIAGNKSIKNKNAGSLMIFKSSIFNRAKILWIFIIHPL